MHNIIIYNLIPFLLIATECTEYIIVIYALWGLLGYCQDFQWHTKVLNQSIFVAAVNFGRYLYIL